MCIIFVSTKPTPTIFPFILTNTNSKVKIKKFNKTVKCCTTKAKKKMAAKGAFGWNFSCQPLRFSADVKNAASISKFLPLAYMEWFSFLPPRFGDFFFYFIFYANHFEADNFLLCLEQQENMLVGSGRLVGRELSLSFSVEASSNFFRFLGFFCFSRVSEVNQKTSFGLAQEYKKLQIFENNDHCTWLWRQKQNAIIFIFFFSLNRKKWKRQLTEATKHSLIAN